MDIIIVLLVLVNACMIIAIKENSDNINVDSKTYFLMKLYGEDEYGKAVDYAQKYSLKLEENKKNATQDFKECVAVADYYKAAFYKNVYAVGKDSQNCHRWNRIWKMHKKEWGKCPP